jgi:5-methylcytosine-specific restriction protein B
MTIEDRQRQFKEKISSLAGIRPDARVAENFGFSNSARVLEGGLFACTNNLQTYSRNLVDEIARAVSQFVFLCVLTFPPQDEVYFAIVVGQEAAKVNRGLVKLAREVEARNTAARAAGRTPSSINNNVKFYITTNGNIYFHNTDFLNKIEEATLDPDCLARVDDIWFSIWPPAISARRSLLAREFVGYLGNLVGPKNVHELTVWPDETTVSAAMRRMPATIPIGEIEASVKALGGFYPGGEIRRFHAAMNFLEKKHFVILSGLSGTGKTQLALKYARAVHGVSTNEAKDPLLFVCPVRPEWTDPTGLTGYYDVLSNRYVVPQFLEAVLVATAHRESPVFVVLDEMNLARVEHYFSDVLSCIETGEPLQLHSNSVPIEGSTGTSIIPAIPVPSNLYITGTVNVDETTNPVSNKVLDRAIVIDMSNVDLAGFLADLEERETKLKNARAAAEPRLVAVQALMAPQGLGFGYRVAEEVLRYHAFATETLKAQPDAVIDDLMVQKVLVKLRGSETQRKLLTDLTSTLASLPKSEAFLRRLTDDLTEFGSFQATR